MSKTLTLDIAHRCQTLQPSPTLTLNAKANELKAAGKQVLNFTVGECENPTPAVIVEAAKRALDQGKTRYSAPGGSPALRKAIAQKLQRENQLAWADDEIVVGIGAKEILFHVGLGLFNSGDEILIPAPYWVSYTEQVMLAEAKPVIIPIEETLHEQRYVLKPESLEKRSTAHTKAIIINFPNNPSGAIPSPAELRALADYLLDKPWWIISDEIYEYLTFEGKHQSLLNIEPRLKDRFIYINGLSKGFFMTGWRVGYMAAPKKVAQVVRGLQGHSSTCIPPFIEEAAVVALNEGINLVRPYLQGLDEARKSVITWAKNQKGISFVYPQGAFYLFLDLRDKLKASKTSSLELSTRLMEEYFVGVVPGEAFGAPGFVRLSFSVAPHVLQDGLKRIEEALAKL